MKLSDRNSQQASDYAAKRKEQLDRANRLRQERDAQKVAKQMSEDLYIGDRPSRGGSASSAIVKAPSVRDDRSISGVSTTSYSDPRSGASVAERIVVGREAMGFHDPWDPSQATMQSAAPRRTDYGGSAPSKRIIAPSASRTSRMREEEKSTEQEIVGGSAVSGEFLTSSARSNHDLSVRSEVFFSSPLDPEGTLVDVSSMPVLCMSIGDNEVVVGCADHSLYAIHINQSSSGSRGGSHPVVTQMYGKKHGHSDWVTGVCHLADQRVLSCGMDNRLCLWNASRSSCVELPNGHQRSISRVISDSTYNVALSCGYDGNVMAWSFGASSGTAGGAYRGAGRTTAGVMGPTAVLFGHKSPVVECVFKGPTVACGTKEGSLFFWDLPTGTLLNKHRAHKNGPVTALEQINNSTLFVSGGSDGVLKLWDPRTAANGSIAQVDVHASSSRSTTAVVTAIACLNDPRGGDVNYITTGGSDGRVVVTDCRAMALNPRDRLIPVHSWEHHRAPVSSMALAGNGGCVFTSDAAGMVMCYDILGSDDNFVEGGHKPAGRDGGIGIGLRYGLGASSQGGVRAVGCVGGKLVAGGDDGNVLLFSY